MSKQRPWQKFPVTYRATEMQQIAAWIETGESGSVIGLAGCGRSNLLRFLCYRPDALRNYLPDQTGPVALVLIDLNQLPANDPTTLYLVILREFYWLRENFSPAIQEKVAALFMENRATQNPFLAQTALHELLFAFQDEATQVALVLNHFDSFAQSVPVQTLRTLRGLRDGFKETLCFIAGMMQETRYLPAMGELLGRHICWVGPMNEADAGNVVRRATRTSPTPPADDELRTMIDLTGGFPALLRAAGYWRLEQTDLPPSEQWFEILRGEGHLAYWLDRLWRGLSEEEKFALAEVQKGQKSIEQAKKHRQRTIKQVVKQLEADYGPLLDSLAKKGMCYKSKEGWQLMGRLFAAHVERVGAQSLGRIWYDETTRQVIQGKKPVELAKQEKRLMRYFIQHPLQHLTYLQLIQEIWPDDIFQDDEGNPTPLGGYNPLFKLVSNVRAKIKDTAARQLYIVQKKGDDTIQAGYVFYPEGRPEQEPGQESG